MPKPWRSRRRPGRLEDIGRLGSLRVEADRAATRRDGGDLETAQGAKHSVKRLLKGFERTSHVLKCLEKKEDRLTAMWYFYLVCVIAEAMSGEERRTALAAMPEGTRKELMKHLKQEAMNTTWIAIKEICHNMKYIYIRYKGIQSIYIYMS